MYTYNNQLLYFILFVVIVCCECKLPSITKTYEKGLSAYTEERWSECISQFEESLHLYRLYKSVVVNCRLKCKSQLSENIINDRFEELKMYEKFFQIRNCLNDCHKTSFGDVKIESDLEDKMLFNMHARKPYEYLHICYFQMYALPKAASASYTYLAVNPDDKAMKSNLQYYMNQPEVDANEIVDMESDDYKTLFKLGIKSYKQSNWAETVANMEEVLKNYITSEDICRAECERQPDQELSPEFFITVSNNIASLLHCQQLCQNELKMLNYNSGVEFLAEVLNYIQISYYRLDKLKDAAKAVSSYLALMPSDEDMLINKNIYNSLVGEDAFIERSDIVYYHKRDKYEKMLLNIFHKTDNFGDESNNI